MARAKPARAVAVLRRHQADTLVAEVNRGGDMVRAVIRGVDARAPVKTVHATRGKWPRAEPVASLYAQGRVKHVGTQRPRGRSVVVQLTPVHRRCLFSSGGVSGRSDLGVTMRASVLVLLTAFVVSPALAQGPDEAPCAKVAPKDHSNCVVTRDYLTLAKKVIAGKLDPKRFPGTPHGLRESFLSKQEVALINKAVKISLIDLLSDPKYK